MQQDLLLDQYNKATVSDINLESPNCARRYGNSRLCS